MGSLGSMCQLLHVEDWTGSFQEYSWFSLSDYNLKVKVKFYFLELFIYIPEIMNIEQHLSQKSRQKLFLTFSCLTRKSFLLPQNVNAQLFDREYYIFSIINKLLKRI